MHLFWYLYLYRRVEQPESFGSPASEWDGIGHLCMCICLCFCFCFCIFISVCICICTCVVEKSRRVAAGKFQGSSEWVGWPPLLTDTPPLHSSPPSPHFPLLLLILPSSPHFTLLLLNLPSSSSFYPTFLLFMVSPFSFSPSPLFSASFNFTLLLIFPSS